MTTGNRVPTERITSIGARLEELGLEHPERPFMPEMAGLETYGRAHQTVRSLAGELLRCGIASLCAVSPDPGLLLALAAASSLSGVRLHLAHADSTPDALDEVVAGSDVDLVVVDERVGYRFKGGRWRPRVCQVEPPAPVLDLLNQLLGLEPTAVPEMDTRVSAALAAHTVLYTSGSTGRPKGVALPREYGPYWGAVTARMLGMDETSHVYCPLPLYHNMGLHFTAAAAIFAGATLHVRPRFSVSEFWADLERHGATHVPYLGSMIGMLRSRTSQGADFANAPIIGYGAGARPGWVEEFRRRRLHLFELYGATEIGVPLLTPAQPEPRWQGLGKVVPDYEFRLTWGDDEPEQGEPGEIVVRPQLDCQTMAGYWPEMARPRVDKEGWWHTGDLARCIGPYVEFVGRIDETIRRRGENVPALMVESAAQGDEDVIECAAFGVRSELGEQDIVLAVVLREGVGGGAQGRLRQHLVRVLPKFAVPDIVYYVDELPKTPTNKVDKPRLIARFGPRPPGSTPPSGCVRTP